jgi:hypothetical protein
MRASHAEVNEWHTCGLKVEQLVYILYIYVVVEAYMRCICEVITKLGAFRTCRLSRLTSEFLQACFFSYSAVQYLRDMHAFTTQLQMSILRGISDW